MQNLHFLDLQISPGERFWYSIPNVVEAPNVVIESAALTVIGRLAMAMVLSNPTRL